MEYLIKKELEVLNFYSYFRIRKSRKEYLQHVRDRIRCMPILVPKCREEMKCHSSALLPITNEAL